LVFFNAEVGTVLYWDRSFTAGLKEVEVGNGVPIRSEARDHYNFTSI